MVTSDKELVITRSRTQVEWKFNDHIFQVDYFVLPSSTFGIILGKHSNVKTLGAIPWNCGQLTIKFEHEGKLFSLQGEHPSTDIWELIGRFKPAQCQAVLLALQGPFCYSDLADEPFHKLPPSQQSELTQLFRELSTIIQGVRNSTSKKTVWSSDFFGQW